MTASFLLALNVSSYAIYIFDYGAPVGFRLALENPNAITAIITQNGNAYLEGFGHPFWTPVEALWNSSNAPPERETIRSALLSSVQGTKFQYVTGVPDYDLKLINPVAWSYDYHQNVEGKENQDRQLDLLYEYRTNLPLYPQFQTYLRESKVPVLAVWGKGDPIFVPEGAEAFKRDAHDPVVKLLDTGHFALETKREEIAGEILGFLKERLGH